MINGPFSPSPGGTLTLSVTSTSANAALPTTPGDGTIKLTNTGAKTVFIRLGVISTVAALVPGGTPGDMPLQSLAVVTLDRGSSTYIAAICGGSDSSTLLATVGVGG